MSKILLRIATLEAAKVGKMYTLNAYVIVCVCVNVVHVKTFVSVSVNAQSGGRFCVPDRETLDSLCSGSSGDVRSAINSLQFSSLPGDLAGSISC